VLFLDATLSLQHEGFQQILWGDAIPHLGGCAPISDISDIEVWYLLSICVTIVLSPIGAEEATSMFDLPILLVDDEPQVRSFVKTVLLRQGFRVVEADDGLAAFSLIQDFHGRFSLVVSDIGVPHLDGAELSRWVKQHFPSVPVLLLSGGADPLDYMEGNAFLPEPFCASQLINAVRTLLSTS